MKVQTAFRFDEELLAALKEKAKAQKRSLNNYIEFLLYGVVGNIPNDETIEAIYEAENNISLTTIDDLKAYKEALIKGNV
jgi:hypothetical protein